MIKKEFDIYERIYKFVLRVLRFLRKAPRTQKNEAVTLVGANDQKLDGVSPKRVYLLLPYCLRRIERNKNIG